VCRLRLMDLLKLLLSLRPSSSSPTLTLALLLLLLPSATPTAPLLLLLPPLAPRPTLSPPLCLGSLSESARAVLPPHELLSAAPAMGSSASSALAAALGLSTTWERRALREAEGRGEAGLVG
jgi:hypothetical protein